MCRVGQVFSHDGPMLGLYWAYVETCWAILSPMLCLCCWARFGSMLGCVCQQKMLQHLQCVRIWCTIYFRRNCHVVFPFEIGHTCATPGPSGRRDQSCSLQHPWRKLARDWAHFLQGKDCPVSGFASFGTVSFKQPVWRRIVICAPKNLSIKKDIFLTYKPHIAKYVLYIYIYVYIL